MNIIDSCRANDTGGCGQLHSTIMLTAVVTEIYLRFVLAACKV